MQPTLEETRPIFHRLKANTVDVHERVEQKLQIFSPTFSLENYLRLLEHFYGFWAPLEAELQEVNELWDPSLRFSSRLKTYLLELDLKTFEKEPTSVPRCRELPDVRTLPKALGCLYVLEGSTLGGQFIAKHVRQRFGLDAGSGASFFNAYGGEVGARWTEFRTFVTAHSPMDSLDELTNSAKQTFEALEAWLAR